MPTNLGFRQNVKFILNSILSLFLKFRAVQTLCNIYVVGVHISIATHVREHYEYDINPLQNNIIRATVYPRLYLISSH